MQYDDLVSALRWHSENDPFYRSGMDHYEMNRQRFERAVEVLGPIEGCNIYDFGSFPGYGLWAFRGCKQYIGVGKCPDWYRDALIEKFNAAWLECDFENATDMLAPPVHPDIVLLQEVIEHIRRPKAFLKALHQWMPSGTRLYLTTNNLHYVGYILKLIAGKEIFHPAVTEDTVYPGHCTYYSLSGLCRFLEDLGFDVLFSTRFNILPPGKFYRNRFFAAIKNGLTKSVPDIYSTHLEIVCKKR